MAFRRQIIWTSVAIEVVLTISALSTAGAQAPGANREPPPPYRPAAGTKDLRAVLFNWTWHMGMLRGIEEHELQVSLEYRAEGTIQVNGQACAIAPFKEAKREGELGTSGYRLDASYQQPGYRTEIKCTLPNGRTYSNVGRGNYFRGWR